MFYQDEHHLFNIVKEFSNQKCPKTVLIIPFFNNPALAIFLFSPNSRRPETKNLSKNESSQRSQFFIFQIRQDFTLLLKNQIEMQKKLSENIPKLNELERHREDFLPDFDHSVIIITERLGVCPSNWKTEKNNKIGNLHFLFSDDKGIHGFDSKN